MLPAPPNQHEHYPHDVGLYALVALLFGHIIFVPMFYYFQVPAMVAVNLVSVAIYSYCIYLYPKAIFVKNYRTIVWLTYLELISHALLASYYIGLDSGFQFYVFLLSALPLFFKQALTIKMFFFIAVCVAMDISFSGLQAQVIVDEQYLLILRNINLTVFLVASSWLSYFYSKASGLYQDKLLVAASIDPLTSLYNRRYLVQAAEREIAAYTRTNQSLSFIILDIDHFKEVNDNHGHSFGDLVLQNIADVLKVTVRPRNIVARWGGEEFVILLPNTDRIELTIVAERLRKQVENSIHSLDENEMSVTISLGGATLIHGESFSELLSRADDALYKGKESGRNCYVFSEEKGQNGFIFSE